MIGAVVVACLGASCGMGESSEPTAQPSPDDGRAPVTSPETSADPAFQPLVRVAVADLARRLDVAESDIVVISTEAVTWPDRSLGCPQPDMRYEQVPTDGALIVLSVDAALYRYHSGGSRPPFLCTTKG
jgi:hypothetical protein